MITAAEALQKEFLFSYQGFYIAGEIEKETWAYIIFGGNGTALYFGRSKARTAFEAAVEALKEAQML
jgi:hypothetical protein